MLKKYIIKDVVIMNSIIVEYCWMDKWMWLENKW